MHGDARIARAALNDGKAAWVRLTPEVVEDLGEDKHQLLDAVDEFESVDRPAGHAASGWLKFEALAWHSTTVTYLMLLDRRIEAFYAVTASNVLLSQRDRRRLRPDIPQGLPARQPATLIAWLAKHRFATTPGVKILQHAFAVALQVAELQGTIALVLDPFDDETAAMWLAMPSVQFRRSGADRGDDDDAKPRRLWMPLRLPDRSPHTMRPAYDASRRR
jgi:hypothetical protein